MLDAGVFARHLDLTPLNGRTRGKVCCPFHQERTASLSVDLEAGIFHCFGCGAEGGIIAFAQRVGETLATIEPIEESAFARIVRIARAQKWNREPDSTVAQLADWIRRTRRDVSRVRGAAREPDADWDRLQRAAHLETLANWAEAELDAITAGV